MARTATTRSSTTAKRPVAKPAPSACGASRPASGAGSPTLAAVSAPRRTIPSSAGTSPTPPPPSCRSSTTPSASLAERRASPTLRHPAPHRRQRERRARTRRLHQGLGAPGPLPRRPPRHDLPTPRRPTHHPLGHHRRAHHPLGHHRRAHRPSGHRSDGHPQAGRPPGALPPSEPAPAAARRRGLLPCLPHHLHRSAGRRRPHQPSPPPHWSHRHRPHRARAARRRRRRDGPRCWSPPASWRRAPPACCVRWSSASSWASARRPTPSRRRCASPT